MDDGDPGWPISLHVFLFLVPGGWMAHRLWRRRRPPARADGLVLIRQLFLSFCGAIVMMGFVVVILWRTSEVSTDAPHWVAVGLLAAGALAVLVGPRIARPLDCADDARLVGSYRTRFFLRLAFAEMAALLGFVGFILTWAPWTYAAGAALTAVGFARLAPTAANLREDQERLNAAGCSRSLVCALRSFSPPTAGAD